MKPAHRSLIKFFPRRATAFSFLALAGVLAVSRFLAPSPLSKSPAQSRTLPQVEAASTKSLPIELQTETRTPSLSLDMENVVINDAKAQIYPIGGNNKSLGTSEERWKSIYAKEFTLDKTGKLTLSGGLDLVDGNLIVDDSLRVRDGLKIEDSTTLGQEATDLLTVNATATFQNDVTINGGVNILGSADISGTKQEYFTIDSDNTGGELAIVFGQTNNERLTWNAAGTQFEFSDELQVGGNMAVTGNITSGTWNGSTIGTAYGGLGASVTAAGAGELLYSTGTTTYGHLAAGSSNQVLISGGAGAPSWSTIGGSNVTNDSLDFTEFKDSLALDASTDIAADNAEVLSITNTSTGDSFVVNDTSSDTTPFIIDSGGSVGIGTTAVTAGSMLDVRGSILAGTNSSDYINVGGTGGLYGYYTGFWASIGFNNYFNGAAFKYGASNAASLFQFASTDFYFYTAAAGNAGEDVSFNETLRYANSGDLYFNIVKTLSKSSTEMVINDDGNDYDFRVEGASNPNLLITDSTNSRVGIGDATPASLFTVGSGDLFQVDTSGDMVKIKNVTYAWPAANAAGSLTNDGNGTLSWASSTPGADTLDFAQFEDTLDLDANLTLNQTTYTWSQDFTGTTTTGLTYAANSLTTGTAMTISSTSTAGGGSGTSKLLNLDRSGANSNASHTAYGIYSNVANSGTTSTNVGGYFSASGATNNYAGIFANGRVGVGDTTPDALLDIDSTSTAGGDFLITNTGVGTTGTVAGITANSVTNGDVFTINATGLGNGRALAVLGSNATGLTNTLVHFQTDVTAGSPVLKINGDVTGTVSAGYGINVAMTDQLNFANTSGGIYSTAVLTGNGAKTHTGYYQSITSSSTTADTLIGFDMITTVSGIMTTGTRSIYGVRSQPASGSESTGGTTNVYGVYSKPTADVGAGGTVNGYGLYVANGTYDTDGTSANYGIYVESPTGADTNYAAIFAGGSIGIGDTTPDATLDIDSTSTTGGDFLITNTGVGTTGTVAGITANSVTGSDILTISATSLSGGSAVVVTGPTGSNGSSDDLIKVSGQISSNASTLKLSPTYYGAGGSMMYGLHVAGTDAQAAATTNYGYYGTISIAANAAKTVAGVYQLISTQSTTADTIIDFDAASTVTGIITTGTRNVYGLRSQPASGSESTGGTTNVYGVYSKPTADVGAGGTVNSYGLYIANGTYDTDGTSTNYGIYAESPSGADNNYAAVFAGGNVGIGDTTPDYKLNVEGDITDYLVNIFNDGNATTRKGLRIQAGVDDHTAGASTDNTLIDFFDGDAAPAAVGSITFGNSLTAYNTTSDQRLKENITGTAMGIDDLMNIQVRDYSFIADGQHKTHTGFIAQELINVYPDAVSVPQDNGYWMVDYGKITPLIIKAVQDQQGEIINTNTNLTQLSLSVDSRLAAVDATIGLDTQQVAEEIAKRNADSLNTEITDVKEQIAGLTDRVALLETTQSTPSAQTQQSVESSSLKTQIDSLQSQLDFLLTQATASTSTSESTESATLSLIVPSLEVEELLKVIGDLKVTGKTTLADTNIAGKLTMGTLSFSDVDGSINSIGALKLQNEYGSETIDAFNGKIILDKDGNITAKGQVKAETFASSDKTRGAKKLVAGDKSVRVDKDWTQSPASVILTPSFETKAWIEDLDEKGFTIKVSDSSSSDQTVYWLAIF